MTKGELLSEEFVKRKIIQWLSANDWGKYLKYGDLREKGVDIRVRHNKFSRYFLIEAKGESKIRQGQEVAFVYSLGQIISRMNTSGKTRYYYGIGLPESAAKIALRRLPWQVALKLLLFVFSVDKDGVVTRYSWKELKKLQQKK